MTPEEREKRKQELLKKEHEKEKIEKEEALVQAEKDRKKADKEKQNYEIASDYLRKSYEREKLLPSLRYDLFSYPILFSLFNLLLAGFVSIPLTFLFPKVSLVVWYFVLLVAGFVLVFLICLPKYLRKLKEAKAKNSDKLELIDIEIDELVEKYNGTKEEMMKQAKKIQIERDIANRRADNELKNEEYREFKKEHPDQDIYDENGKRIGSIKSYKGD